MKQNSLVWIARTIACGFLVAALSALADSSSVTVETEGQTVYLKNNTTQSLRCFVDYFISSGAKWDGDSRTVDVPAGGRTAAVEGVISGFNVKSCKRTP